MFGNEDSPIDDGDSEDIDEFHEFEFEPLDLAGATSQEEAKKKTCDHDSKHKEFINEQEARGLSLGGVGGNVGTSNIKIGCKECEKVYEIESEQNQGPGLW